MCACKRSMVFCVKNNMTKTTTLAWEKVSRPFILAVFGLAILGISFLMGFGTAEAETDAGLKVSGWIPYWQDTMGTKDARDNIEKIDTIYPFVFAIKNDGSLSDLGDIGERKWERLFDDAEDENVEVIPTVMSGNGAQLHDILSDNQKRADHIEAILDMIDDGNFDGVDIDYEGKLAKTNPFFALFLLELKLELMQMGSKTLSCTVEPRTPPKDLFRDGEVPDVIERANNYDIIKVVCDRIQLMAYDQQRVDLALNNERKGEPYIPLADTDWVEKVVKYTIEEEKLPAEKIMLGVPTYGHHYMLTVAPEWYREYGRIGALNPPDIEELAEEYDVEPGRNAGGELAFTYFHKTSPFRLLEELPTPEGTRTGMEAAAKALAFANATGTEVPVYIVWYSDAEAVEQKLKLAEKYGLRGVAVFKWDGEEDPAIWNLFE